MCEYLVRKKVKSGNCPTGIRTPALAVRVPYPNQLDYGAHWAVVSSVYAGYTLHSKVVKLEC